MIGMNGERERERERESGKSVLATRIDNDDDIYKPFLLFWAVFVLTKQRHPIGKGQNRESGGRQRKTETLNRKGKIKLIVYLDLL